jgi:hypothetical protein
MEKVLPYWICLLSPQILEIIQVQEAIARRLSHVHQRIDEETLTAHSCLLCGLFTIYYALALESCIR